MLTPTPPSLSLICKKKKNTIPIRSFFRPLVNFLLTFTVKEQCEDTVAKGVIYTDTFQHVVLHWSIHVLIKEIE